MGENPRTAYQIEYKKQHYKRVSLEISLDMYRDLKAAADRENTSVNGYIKSAINEKLSASEKQ